MKIAIIGAGAAGLAALKYGLDQGHTCTAFEQAEHIGGTWNYTDRTNIDEYGLPVHSSMYQGLRTNLPKEVMEYQNFPYDVNLKSYITQPDVLDYINRFATHHNLHPHIKLLRHILEIDPLPNEKWKIKEKHLKSQEISEHIFDAVMICVGNYSTPNIPKIPGANEFTGGAIHSHNYRKSDSYKGKTVLVIGAGPSGVDISRIIGEVAEKVYISYGGRIFCKAEDYVLHKPIVKKLTANTAVFEDGSEEVIDEIIYCTGYLYSYPFLTPKCGIEIENNWVKYLYKHIINIQHPTMGFIGITLHLLFPTVDIQIRFFLEFLKNTNRFSQEEMKQDILKNIEIRKEQALPQHRVHEIAMKLYRGYTDNLADTLGIKRVRPVIQNLYEHLGNSRDINKRYKILNDHEFVEYY
ncbi:senecionine N-oxygenase-like [Sitophilus oryzae]|uniref:Flavin-containing monooxygenase n=1 Tax=Sitophilus oryzae TaxID=7048 RepID=A0A6J2YNE4_SITOR|nr:senecionine N-oxygenase-like [Sitophilus oryzae]